MHIVTEKNGKLIGLNTKEISFPMTKTAENILKAIAEKPTYPRDIAQKLRIHEQKVYYHIKVLEKQGFIHVVSREEHGGVMAKIYAMTKPSFFVKFAEFEDYKKVPVQRNELLSPFIENNELSAKIIVGSPDPHGPERARSRDSYLGVDLGLFLGTFLSKSKRSVFLDTEVRREDLNDNLLLIGGPVINRITKQVNAHLPVRFDNKRRIYSSLTKKTYAEDENGIIVKTKSPFNAKKSILVIAGRRYSGTAAAMMAFTQRFEEISKKNRGFFCHVVKGIDEDGDGIVDNVKILE